MYSLSRNALGRSCSFLLNCTRNCRLRLFQGTATNAELRFHIAAKQLSQVLCCYRPLLVSLPLCQWEVQQRPLNSLRFPWCLPRYSECHLIQVPGNPVNHHSRSWGLQKPC
jgi:hypothetical protein